ncbi:hypothetical protein bas69_0081 [Escherichia phage AlfredRasser]|nr:hypothetical protein bas69_0081 [Escherichia phage AlfredRasser]
MKIVIVTCEFSIWWGYTPYTISTPPPVFTSVALAYPTLYTLHVASQLMDMLSVSYQSTIGD